MAILVRKPQRAEALLPWARALILAHTAYFIASPGGPLGSATPLLTNAHPTAKYSGRNGRIMNLYIVQQY